MPKSENSNNFEVVYVYQSYKREKDLDNYSFDPNSRIFCFRMCFRTCRTPSTLGIENLRAKCYLRMQLEEAIIFDMLSYRHHI